MDGGVRPRALAPSGRRTYYSTRSPDSIGVRVSCVCAGLAKLVGACGEESVAGWPAGKPAGRLAGWPAGPRMSWGKRPESP